MKIHVCTHTLRVSSGRNFHNGEQCCPATTESSQHLTLESVKLRWCHITVKWGHIARVTQKNTCCSVRSQHAGYTQTCRAFMGKTYKSISKSCSKAQPLMQSRKWRKPQEQRSPTERTFTSSPPPDDTFLLNDCLEEANGKGLQEWQDIPVVTFSSLKIPSTTSIMLL